MQRHKYGDEVWLVVLLRKELTQHHSEGNRVNVVLDRDTAQRLQQTLSETVPSN